MRGAERQATELGEAQGRPRQPGAPNTMGEEAAATGGRE